MEDTDDVIALYRRAVKEFGVRVHLVAAGQWELPTPCEDWNVRQLVNHLAGENAWAVPLLAGATMAEVGDSLDGDLLGDDPAGEWDSLAAAATAAAGAGDDVLERTVHVSFGDIPGREYLSQLTIDHVIHSWDLARAVGGDEQLDADLVDFAYRALSPQAEGWRAAGVLGPAVEVASDAPTQTRLLALSGRGG